MPQFTPFDARKLLQDFLPALPSFPTVTLSIDAADIDERGPRGLDPAVRASMRSFFEELHGRVEPVVVSITGPVTVDLELIQQGIEHARASSASIDFVFSQAQAVMELAAQILPGAPVMLFLEEPGLANSMHPTFPLRPDEIEDLVSGVVEPLGEDALVGLQVGGRADWALLLRTGISILGAPITAGFESAAEELGRFLEGGGFVAWGAIPVDEPLGAGVDRYWKRLSARWADLAQVGIDPLLLREQSIITPAASLGEFGLSQAERVLRLTAELSERVFNQVIGARFSIGA